jgi:hypothetical protein
MPGELMEVPREVMNSFEHVQGIPLGVIAELFHRAEFPTEQQAAFWHVAAAKSHKYCTGKVRINTKRDGKKEVLVFDGGGTVKFHVPDDLTDEQFAEVKRAQGARLPVAFEYQEEGGKKSVNEVTVYEAPADEPKWF